MTPQEIFKNCSELKDSDIGWEKFYAIVLESLKTNKYRVLRKGNTLFWIRIDQPHVAQVFLFNADSYKNLFRNMKEFAKAMELAGYKKWYGDTQDMNIVNLIKRLGYSVDVEKIGKDSHGRQLYRGTANV